MIIMDSKAQLTVDIITKVAEGKMTIVNATKLLNKSRRTIERYLKRYQKIGIPFFIHQNSGKSPANKSAEELKRAVQTLIKEKYFVSILPISESCWKITSRFESNAKP